MTVKLIAERRTGRLLGAQIVGRTEAAKRIDALAVALWNGMTVEEMTALDLGYAPPFAPVWDPVLIAARKAHGRGARPRLAAVQTEHAGRSGTSTSCGRPARPGGLGAADQARLAGAAVDVHLAAVPVDPRRAAHRLRRVCGVDGVDPAARRRPRASAPRRSSHSAAQRVRVDRPARRGSAGCPARNSTSVT